ncbi:hypothetical protein ABGB07_02145 [Micromonosporaceae bacterium B7E4]
MTALALDVLPLCNVCFAPVDTDVDTDTLQPIEVCSVCDLRQRQVSSFTGIPLAVRAVRVLAWAGELQPVLCRACAAGRHATCHVVRCTCNHPGATP